ncbi:catechol 2,3-dioxygenase-like lactoylglutathione lyase family enzyme [Azospirillum fermentarium]|uniref:VOC family protein n=1 Tax=Azospirillum fermentarium TaxID=1233114 RepID=UPI002226B25E|nr:VOC family protein [Azospirillum fermentarium]MCW2244930.1 catechol 2,3-dioxygenase-like lactoylglutathione lyase family enzyme [Azospirillum fermentarium]
MTTPANVFLYVKDPLASADFYAKILGRGPLEASPGFALFELVPGMMLGLWARDGVEPAPEAAPGAAELGFPVAARAAVDDLHAEWTAKGLTILQAPVKMDFGYTFAAADPDGHRLRVYVLEDMG